MLLFLFSFRRQTSMRRCCFTFVLFILLKLCSSCAGSYLHPRTLNFVVNISKSLPQCCFGVCTTQNNAGQTTDSHNSSMAFLRGLHLVYSFQENPSELAAVSVLTPVKRYFYVQIYFILGPVQNEPVMKECDAVPG